MAKIFYSMAGEGRGHAARVRSMVELLRHEHQLVLFAPDQAFEFLAPRYPAGFSNVEVRRIPGLRFHYSHGRMDLTKTFACAAGYLWKLPGLVSQLSDDIRTEQPDLVVADFEPALPRAARRCKVSFVSLNHQHFLVACDLSSLPFSLRTHAGLMSLAVQAHHSGQDATVVSSFFRAPLRRGYEFVTQVGPLLRPEILKIRANPGEYLVSYLRPNSPPHVLEMLRASDREVRVYGLGERDPDGPLKFCKLDEKTFVDDLAGSAALVGAAGNQTLGESLYLGKPVLALPEQDHHEQLINSHFLKQMGGGDWVTIEQVRPTHLTNFLGRLDEYRDRIVPQRARLNGTPAALAEISRFLPQPRRTSDLVGYTRLCEVHA